MNDLMEKKILTEKEEKEKRQDDFDKIVDDKIEAKMKERRKK